MSCPPDLTRLNLLLTYHDSTADLHKKVAVILKQCITRVGVEMVQRDQTVAVISVLVAHYVAYAGIVQSCFSGRAAYDKALKEAFEDFLNRSTVVASLLARYTHDALSRGSKVSESDMDRVTRGDEDGVREEDARAERVLSSEDLALDEGERDDVGAAEADAVSD